MDELPVNPGDIYWLIPDVETGIAHPHVVIQVDDVSVMVCALTSNINKVTMPGNLLLDVDEANLPRRSVVEVSKNFVVDKTQLSEYIGTLSADRLKQIAVGLRFVRVAFLRRA